MNRQQAFEAIYAKQHDVPEESLVQHRFESKEGYSVPGIASHYRTYCNTLDSIVVEIPKPAGLDRMSSEMSMQEIREDNRFNRALELAKKALTAAGVKYK